MCTQGTFPPAFPRENEFEGEECMYGNVSLSGHKKKASYFNFFCPTYA